LTSPITSNSTSHEKLNQTQSASLPQAQSQPPFRASMHQKQPPIKLLHFQFKYPTKKKKEKEKEKKKRSKKQLASLYY
jgi:hypothetical protein